MPQNFAPVERDPEACKTDRVRLRVEMFADLVCPWCFIGTRTLANAAALRADIELEVHWRPFLLHPHLSTGGAPFRPFLEEKFGRPFGDMFRRVITAGDEVGVAFAFDRIETMPDTTLAHALIGWATEPGQQAALVQRLFEAFFVEGENLENVDVLIECAESVGMPPDLRRRLMDDGARSEARDAAEAALDIGVTGVPFYMIGGWPVQGSQDATILARVIDKAAAKQRAKRARTP